MFKPILCVGLSVLLGLSPIASSASDVSASSDVLNQTEIQNPFLQNEDYSSMLTNIDDYSTKNTILIFGEIDGDYQNAVKSTCITSGIYRNVYASELSMNRAKLHYESLGFEVNYDNEINATDFMSSSITDMKKSAVKDVVESDNYNQVSIAIIDTTTNQSNIKGDSFVAARAYNPTIDMTHGEVVANAIYDNLFVPASVKTGDEAVYFPVNAVIFGALDQNGKGSLAAVMAYLKYAIDNNFDVINISVDVYPYILAMKPLLEKASDKGIYVNIAAGNHGNEYPEAIDLDNVKVITCDGGNIIKNARNRSDIMIDMGSNNSYDYNGQTHSGSSIATAYVTARVASVLAINNTVNPYDYLTEVPDIYIGDTNSDVLNNIDEILSSVPEVDDELDFEVESAEQVHTGLESIGVRTYKDSAGLTRMEFPTKNSTKTYSSQGVPPKTTNPGTSYTQDMEVGVGVINFTFSNNTGTVKGANSPDGYTSRPRFNYDNANFPGPKEALIFAVTKAATNAGIGDATAKALAINYVLTNLTMRGNTLIDAHTGAIVTNINISDVIQTDNPGCTGPECDGANGQQPVGDASGCEYDISKKYSDTWEETSGGGSSTDIWTEYNTKITVSLGTDGNGLFMVSNGALYHPSRIKYDCSYKATEYTTTCSWYTVTTFKYTYSYRYKSEWKWCTSCSHDSSGHTTSCHDYICGCNVLEDEENANTTSSAKSYGGCNTDKDAYYGNYTFYTAVPNDFYIGTVDPVKADGKGPDYRGADLMLAKCELTDKPVDYFKVAHTFTEGTVSTSHTSSLETFAIPFMYGYADEENRPGLSVMTNPTEPEFTGNEGEIFGGSRDKAWTFDVNLWGQDTSSSGYSGCAVGSANKECTAAGFAESANTSYASGSGLRGYTAYDGDHSSTTTSVDYSTNYEKDLNLGKDVVNDVNGSIKPSTGTSDADDGLLYPVDPPYNEGNMDLTHNSSGTVYDADEVFYGGAIQYGQTYASNTGFPSGSIVQWRTKVWYVVEPTNSLVTDISEKYDLIKEVRDSGYAMSSNLPSENDSNGYKSASNYYFSSITPIHNENNYSYQIADKYTEKTSNNTGNWYQITDTCSNAASHTNALKDTERSTGSKYVGISTLTDRQEDKDDGKRIRYSYGAGAAGATNSYVINYTINSEITKSSYENVIKINRNDDVDYLEHEMVESSDGYTVSDTNAIRAIHFKSGYVEQISESTRLDITSDYSPKTVDGDDKYAHGPLTIKTVEDGFKRKCLAYETGLAATLTGPNAVGDYKVPEWRLHRDGFTWSGWRVFKPGSNSWNDYVKCGDIVKFYEGDVVIQPKNRQIECGVLTVVPTFMMNQYAIVFNANDYDTNGNPIHNDSINGLVPAPVTKDICGKPLSYYSIALLPATPTFSKTAKYADGSFRYVPTNATSLTKSDIDFTRADYWSKEIQYTDSHEYKLEGWSLYANTQGNVDCVVQGSHWVNDKHYYSSYTTVGCDFEFAMEENMKDYTNEIVKLAEDKFEKRRPYNNGTVTIDKSHSNLIYDHTNRSVSLLARNCYMNGNGDQITTLYPDGGNKLVSENYVTRMQDYEQGRHVASGTPTVITPKNITLFAVWNEAPVVNAYSQTLYSSEIVNLGVDPDTGVYDKAVAEQALFDLLVSKKAVVITDREDTTYMDANMTYARTRKIKDSASGDAEAGKDKNLNIPIMYLTIPNYNYDAFIDFNEDEEKKTIYVTYEVCDYNGFINTYVTPVEIINDTSIVDEKEVGIRTNASSTGEISYQYPRFISNDTVNLDSDEGGLEDRSVWRAASADGTYGSDANHSKLTAALERIENLKKLDPKKLNKTSISVSNFADGNKVTYSVSKKNEDGTYTAEHAGTGKFTYDSQSITDNTKYYIVMKAEDIVKSNDFVVGAYSASDGSSVSSDDGVLIGIGNISSMDNLKTYWKNIIIDENDPNHTCLLYRESEN